MLEGGVEKMIILADASKASLMYLGLLLKRFGIKVLPVQNGLKALNDDQNASARPYHA
jgi:hypothetical protein